MHIIVKKPSDCSEAELQDFVELILAGCEVTSLGLDARVRAAASLVMLTVNGCLTGIGAIKQPLPDYRKSISEKADVALSPVAFPYELGWVFVLLSARGHKLSQFVVKEALSSITGAGIFATSRSDNLPMHRSLERFGFVRLGRVYTSDRGNHQLQLFALPSAQQGSIG